MQCSKCGASCPEEAQFCPNCGAPMAKAPQAQQGMPSVVSPYGQPQQGMKWFQIMRVFMVLGAIGGAANAVLLVTGMTWMQSGYDPSWVYGLYPAMQARDIFSGVLYLGAAVLCGMTAYCMTKYDRRTPLLATIIYGVTCTISVVSALLSDAVVGVFPYEDVSMAGAYVVLGIVMVLVNRSYFNKRKHLFVK